MPVRLYPHDEARGWGTSFGVRCSDFLGFIFNDRFYLFICFNVLNHQHTIFSNFLGKRTIAVF